MNQFDEIVRALDVAQIDYKTNEPLAKYTSFKIGGPCPVMIFPKNREEASAIMKVCAEVPRLILGNGSNMLAADEGFDGAVIQFGNQFVELKLLDETTIYASAGVSLVKLCTFAYENGLSGLEFAYGIPASVGGAIYMNAGAYNGEMKDVLVCAEHLTADGTCGSFLREELCLSYRHSAYTNSDLCILGGEFRLEKADPQKIRARMDELMERRKTKQPLEFPSAGSTFKRPPNAFAAKLIEDCGLKGLMVGGAQVSEKHSGFVINRGGATCEDVKALIREVQRRVLEQSGIQLECEVKMIG